MANTIRDNYDTSIGTNDRSLVAATKLWAIVIGLIVLLGVIMLLMFMTGSMGVSSGPVSSENTSTRPAEP
jgi:hypothetical protein